MRKSHRELSAKLTSLGIETVSLIHGGKHIRLHCKSGAREFETIISGTPSDRRWTLNKIAEIKRMVRARA